MRLILLKKPLPFSGINIALLTKLAWLRPVQTAEIK